MEHVKQAELSYLNNYLDELAIYEKVPAVHLSNPGLQKLSGRQTVASFSSMTFAGSILNAKNKVIDQARFPLDGQSVGKRIDSIWYLTTDLKTTTTSIHNFIHKNIKPLGK